jgi:hypothetical protein
MELIQTTYGEVRAARLEELQSSLHTRQILQLVEDLAGFCTRWKRELRDDLLAVHSMAHTVIKGAPLTRVPGEESLPEAARWLSDKLREWRESLAAAIALLDQIGTSARLGRFSVDSGRCAPLP